MATQSGQVVILDCTALKSMEKNQWHQEKHGILLRCAWRKLHKAIDETHQVLECE